MEEGLVPSHVPRALILLRPYSPLALLIGLAACSHTASRACAGATITPGEAMLRVADGSIWYRISGTGRGTPVILLHGGPGYSSYYMKPFEALGDDRRVVRRSEERRVGKECRS